MEVSSKTSDTAVAGGTILVFEDPVRYAYIGYPYIYRKQLRISYIHQIITNRAVNWTTSWVNNRSELDNELGKQ